MSVKLITGSSRNDKTEIALDLICSIDPTAWAKNVRYVVPTVEMAREIELKLIRKMNLSGILGNVVCTFYGFSGDFLTQQGTATKLITDIQKDLLLNELIDASGLEYFQASAAFPDFISSLDQIIGELKLSLIEPEALRIAFEQSKERLNSNSCKKLGELINIYLAYQNEILIKHSLHDREGLMWLALECAQKSDLMSQYKYVVFDGFNGFNEIQRAFISFAAESVPNVAVTMQYESGRRSIFDCLEEEKGFILSLSGASEQKAERSLDNFNSLSHLTDNLFNKNVPKIEPDTSLMIIQAGNMAIEVELVAEEICRKVRAGDLRFSDILITGANIGSYEPYLSRVFPEYNIPLQPLPRPAAESAIVNFLVACCDLIVGNWKREDVLKVVGSGLLDSDVADACQMQIDATQLGVLFGKDSWLERWDEDDTTLDFRKRALASVEAFEDDLGKSDTPAEFANAVRTLMSSVSREIYDQNIAALDASAKKVIDRVLTELVDGLRILKKRTNANDFLKLLQSALIQEKLQPASSALDCVQLRDAVSVFGQSYKVVFVLGVLEKVLPREPRENAFIRDEERRALNEYLCGRLKLRLEQKGSEKNLFYTLVSTAKDQLCLCYPMNDNSGQETLRSFFIDEVEKLFSSNLHIIKREISEFIPKISQAESLRALYRSVIHSIAAQTKNIPVETFAFYNSLISTGNSVLTWAFANSIERDAQILDDTILQELANPLNSYRCSELESYAACPFMHFCTSTLGLEALNEQIGAMDVGTVLHRVLYLLYSGVWGKGDKCKLSELELEPTLETAFDFLDQEFRENSRINNLPTYRKAFLKNSIQEYLHRFISGDIKFGRDNFIPSYFELGFGKRIKEGTQRDPKSVTRLLQVTDENGCEALLQGSVDRVDVGTDGAVIIDYKSGTSISINNFEKKLTFQAIIYAVAVQKMFGLQVLGAEYRSLKQWKVSGYYVDSTGFGRGKNSMTQQQFQEKLQTCENLIVAIVEKIRSGIIAVEPAECKKYCSYRGICRIDAR